MADVVENLNELYKKVYSKTGPKDVVPEMAKIQQDIEYSNSEKVGEKYVETVRLAYPGGFTHALGDGTAGAFNLNDSKSGTQKKIEISSNQILLRDQMSYEDAGKAVQGERAFKSGTDLLFSGLRKSMRKRIETMCLYGSAGLGLVGTYTSGDPSITILSSEWAPQIWAGCEGSEIDVMQGSTSTVRGTVTIAKVDIENKKIWLSGTVTGCVANDTVYFKGNYGQEMLGIYKILNTSGSLWGIDNSIYSLFKPTVHTLSSAAMSFDALKKAIAKAVAKGLDEEVTVYLNPGGWSDLQSSIEALRVTSERDVRKVEIGAEEMVYHSQNGKAIIKSHPMIKEGHALGLCLPYWKRVGAVDVEMGAPGLPGGSNPFFHLSTKAGIEARMYTNQAALTTCPAMSFMITGIVNTP